jgi:hypothetical protein
MPTRKSRPTVLSSVARGAIAGLIGGAVLTTAHRVLVPRLSGRTRRGRREPDVRAAAVSSRLFGDLSPRVRTRVELATQLVSAAMLGAAYGVAVEQFESSRSGRNLIDAALVFGASLIAPDLTPRRRRMGSRKAKLRQRVLAPFTGPAVYGGTTSAALKLLAG